MSAVTIAITQSTPMSGQVRSAYGARKPGAVPPVPTLIAIGSSTSVSETVTTRTTARTTPCILTLRSVTVRRPTVPSSARRIHAAVRVLVRGSGNVCS
jgi:hypothetical protein